MSGYDDDKSYLLFNFILYVYITLHFVPEYILSGKNVSTKYGYLISRCFHLIQVLVLFVF